MSKENEQNLLIPIDTPFGRIYIENWENNTRTRYCDDRITIYDSRKDWLDYYCEDYFYDDYDPTETSLTKEEWARQEYDKLCEMYRKGGECTRFEDFIDWMGISYVYAGDNREEAEYALSDGAPGLLLPNEVETNEYVNHIGKYYVVVDQ